MDVEVVAEFVVCYASHQGRTPFAIRLSQHRDDLRVDLVRVLDANQRCLGVLEVVWREEVVHVVGERLHERLSPVAMAREFVISDRCVDATKDEERACLALFLRLKHDHIRLVVVEVVLPDLGLLPHLVPLAVLIERLDCLKLAGVLGHEPASRPCVAVDDVQGTLDHRHIDGGAFAIAPIDPSRLINAVALDLFELKEGQSAVVVQEELVVG